MESPFSEFQDIDTQPYIHQLGMKDFHLSIDNLLITDDPKKRHLYLENIFYKLANTDPASFELMHFDFFLGNFLISPTLLADRKFNYGKLFQLVVKIQVILVHIFFPDQVSDFFDPDSETFLFSWDQSYILAFLTEFNNSMTQNYGLTDFHLKEYEKTLFDLKVEQQILDYLFELYESDKSNIEPLKIIVEAIPWMNESLVFNEKIIQYTITSMIEDNEPLLILVIQYYTKKLILMGSSPSQPNFLFDCMQNYNILDIIYQHIKKNDLIEIGKAFYQLLDEDFFVYPPFLEQLILSQLKLLSIPIYKHQIIPKSFRRLFPPGQLIDGSNIFETIIQSAAEILQQEPTEANSIALSNYIYMVIQLRFMSFEGFLQEIYSDSSSTTIYTVMKNCKKLISSKPYLIYELLIHFLIIFKLPDTEQFYLQIYQLYFDMYIHCTTYSIVEETKEERKKILQEMLDWSFHIPNPEVFELFKNKIIHSENFAKQLQMLNLAQFVIVQYVKSMDRNLIEFALIIYKNCAIKNLQHQKEKIKAELKEIIDKTPVNSENAISMLMVALIANDKLNIILTETVQKVLTCDPSILQDVVKFIPDVIKELHFNACDMIFDLALENLNQDIVIEITKCKTDQFTPDKCQELPNNVMHFGELIMIYLKQTFDAYQSSDGLSDQLYYALSKAISFFGPIITFIPPENVMFLTQLLSNGINEGKIRGSTLSEFISAILPYQYPLFDSIKWTLFDSTKHAILTFESFKWNQDIENLSIELINYQFLMFSVDLCKAFALFQKKTCASSSKFFETYSTLFTRKYQSEDEKKHTIQAFIRVLKHPQFTNK